MTLPADALGYTADIRTEREAIRQHVRACDMPIALLRSHSDPEVRRVGDVLADRVERIAARAGGIAHDVKQIEEILLTLAGEPGSLEATLEESLRAVADTERPRGHGAEGAE